MAIYPEFKDSAFTDYRLGVFDCPMCRLAPVGQQDEDEGVRYHCRSCNLNADGHYYNEEALSVSDWNLACLIRLRTVIMLDDEGTSR